MKTYNQIKAYFNLGPVDMHRPIADIGNMKSPYNRPRFGINASKKKKEKKENNIKEERNYRNEYDNYHKKPEQRERNAARLRARRLMDRWGRVKRFDKKDVHHKDNNPLNNEEDNLAVTTQKWNRTEPRLRLTKSIRGK